jgi:tetratricopeptide (TPR) repeat protein
LTQSSTAGGGLEAMRRGIELLREQNVLAFDGLFKKALAEAEAEAGDVDRALAVLDEALATCDRTGCCAFEADLHRVRGEMLLKRDPVNPAPAEEAFQTAIAVAREQGTLSFELRAALSLAKLYQSTNRSAEALTVLSPALEGFSPTPEMPEIAEAQALLAELAETDEVKSEMAWRERRLRLESQYAEAVGWSKGFAAEETKAAFDRVANALMTGSGADTEPTIAHMVRWSTTFMRGEIGPARQAAQNWLRAAEEARSLPKIAAANRNLGATLVVEGDLAEAKKYLEEAMKVADRAGNFDPAGGAGSDPATSAAAHLSLTCWIAGEPDHSR